MGGLTAAANGTSVFAGIVGGAIGGFVTGATMGAIPFTGAFAGSLTGAVSGAIGGATSSMVTQVLDDSECLSWGKVGNDALWGGIGGGALGMVGQGLKGPLGLAVSADVSIWSGVISSETR